MGKLEGEKGKLDSVVRNAHDTSDEKPEPRRAADSDDKLGDLADAQTIKVDTAGEAQSASDQRSISSSLEVVKHSFHWFNEAAQRRIETLRVDLKKEDEPGLFAQLAEALLGLALGAGVAAAGVRLAQKFAPTAGEVGKEFVKVLFEGGIGVGVAAGQAKLSSGNDNNVIDPFVESQKKGVEATQFENQRQFIKVRQHEIKTVETAEELEAACSKDNIFDAADEQYAAARDAWVSYLAQTKFGAIGARGAVQKDDLNVGPTHTNMSSEEQRKKTNKSVPGFVPSDAPTFENSVFGEAPGVLAVAAELPKIDFMTMSSKPKVERALMNGVNGNHPQAVRRRRACRHADPANGHGGSRPGA